jgi:predicted NUDIX family NTP pyrophosphohydrolase
MTRRSAGLLLYRRTAGLEVLLAHPGGPVWAKRDDGAWSLPKGEIEPDEATDPYAVARREFEEETGHAPPDAEAIPLGEIRQKGGKVVVAWALEGDLDPATARSNTFPFEWPPRSGRWITIPEIDRVAWFTPDEAHRRIKDTQWPLVERLLAALGELRG